MTNNEFPDFFFWSDPKSGPFLDFPDYLFQIFNFIYPVIIHRVAVSLELSIAIPVPESEWRDA